MPRRRVRTEPVTVTAGGHRTELLYDDGENDGVLVCAAHGGRVEPGTAEQALELATTLEGATCWATLAYHEDGGEFDRFHPPSTALDRDDHPLLDAIADRGFETVVSLHGLSDDGVLVGGGADDGRKRRVADRLDVVLSATVEVVAAGPYAGSSPENFVNWLASGAGGVQLEMGPAVRDDEGDAVVDALASMVRAGRL